MADNNFDNSDEDQEDEMPQEQKDALLLEAVKENDFAKVEEMIGMNASPSVEKDGWNPLLWSSCNGNESIVRLLIKHNA
jgi:ankyrin repeat protein